MAEQALVTGDVQLIRRLNRDAILGLIRKQGPISRTALARLVHLTPATVFSIVEELVQDGLVQKSGIGPSQGGRRPMLFEFNPRSYAVIGINIRSAQVLGVLTYLDAIPQVTIARDYDLEAGANVVQLVKDVSRELIAASPVPLERLMGIGLAVPGLIDVERGVVVESRNWGWEELPLREILAQEIDLPIYIEEDDNALALGEGFFGAGRGISNVVCVKVGRGLGAGIIVNGGLFRGPDNAAGEISHILVDPEGPQCYCGNYGCLTRLASAPAIAERAIKGLKQGAVSSLRERVGGDLERITVAMIAEAANAGDPFARQVMEETGRYLGIAIATLVNLLNPDLVIIGGGVILAGAPLLEPIRHVVKLRTHTAPGRRVQIVPAKLGVEAPAIGAATFVMIQEGVLPTQGTPCLS
ncbi:MAG TPA: ROK family protein [Anaerolineae bacterium]|nr:ROK family protein [Anaerolineae bacterium]HIQ04940.1 ROK family protein [Anaerolineae bacterium]